MFMELFFLKKKFRRHHQEINMVSTKLSVIVPTCNRQYSLIRSVKSVLLQEYQDIEIIIVDDSSEDNTAYIKDIFLFSDKVFVYRNTGPHSAANARNFGVKVAKGEYITFLDDDDIYLQGRLINVMNFVNNDNDYIFVSSGRFSEINNFEKIGNIDKQRFGIVTHADNLYSNDIDIGFTMLRENFIELGGFNVELKSLEDWDFVLRALSLKDGYKINRLDYAVNIEPNRQRVSNADKESYLLLANMYRSHYGEKWYSYMRSHGESLSGNLSLRKMFRYFIVSRKAEVIKDFLRQHKNEVHSFFNIFR